MNIYLIIPAFNEKERLVETLKSATHFISPSKIIVVDDGSKPPVKLKLPSSFWLLRHKINLGKGAAMRTGAEFAFKNGADAIIFMDADGQHNPQEITHFISQLQSYDVVFGTRSFGNDAPIARLLGKKITSIYISLVFGIYVSDVLSGFRAMTKKAYRKIVWQSNRYEVEAEMVARLGAHKNQLTWVDIPIETIYQFKYKGMTVIDGLRLLWRSIWWRLSI